MTATGCSTVPPTSPRWPTPASARHWTPPATPGVEIRSPPTLPLLVLPTSGAADEETVRAAQRLDPRAVLVADTATSAAGPLLNGPGRGCPC